MQLPPHDRDVIEAIVARALAEDVGSGDVTCAYFVAADQQCRATIVAREKGIAAGVEVAEMTFRQVDPMLEVTLQRQSGDPFSPGDPLLSVTGRVASILTAERVALNFLQRLSGVATLTHRFVTIAAPFGAKVLDTRKTTPGLRLLEKRAVAAGGGVNHRFGLYDMVMVKDNHLAAESDLSFLQAAIDRLKAERPEVRVELETDTLAQVRDFLTLRGVDVILLDNMTNAEMREAVALGKKRVLFEASGGVNLATIGGIAATGVDYVSIGALTHSARAIDFSLELTR